MNADLAASIRLATPELMLGVGALVLLIIGVYAQRATTLVNALAVLLIVAAAGWMVLYTGDGKAFGGALVSDPFARFMKMLSLVGSAVTLMMSLGFTRREKFDHFEFPVLIVICTLGMMLMISPTIC